MPTSSKASAEPRFHGRRKGPALSARKQALLDEVLPRLAIAACEDPIDPYLLFGAEAEGSASPRPATILLEIGFGKGELLAALAQAHPDWGFIGAEPYINGAVSLIDKIASEDITNIRLWPDDARPLMARLADACLDRVMLIHPDPWPKRRHAKRRFINPPQIDEVARLLKPDGEFWISTDHPVYREWSLVQMAARNDFAWTAFKPEDWQRRPEGWPETRYARKALQGEPVFLIYRRR